MQTVGMAKRSAIVIAAALALSSPIGAQSGYELLQQALSKERAEGKLQEAIALYQRVVDVASTDHALAAKALLQLGHCYETLGSAEARNMYERLIARYPDQTDLVAQARSRITALARAQPTSTPAAMTVQPLPDVGRDGELLAVAPDGTKAIVMDYSKGQNIALYDFSSKQRRLLTDNNWLTGEAYSAVWSSDARRVAYVQANWTNATHELRVTTLDGQSSVVYRTESAQRVQPVGWTPDGVTLVVVAVRPDNTWAVGTIPASGGRFRPLRSFGWSFGSWREPPPRLSPDGRFVAYFDGETGLRDVYVVSLDGGDAYRITDHPGDDFAPIWSPDSRRLAFTSNRQGSVSVWTVTVKDGNPVGQPVKLKDGMQSARLVDWTASGIFYNQQTTSSDLYTVPMDPIEGRQAGSPRLIPYSRTGRNISPAWSPDGGMLAFVSSAAAEPDRRYVVVIPAEGGQAREFLIPTTSYQNPQAPYDLRWFGDGRGLGFSGTDGRGGAAAFRLTLETGKWDTTPLPKQEYGATRIEWNRDGSALYFARRGSTNPGIFERAVNGDSERPVYRLSMPVNSILSLEFSPDRKWLAFHQRMVEANYRGRARIVVLDIETGETRTVLEDVSSLTEGWRLNPLSWTPRGELLVKRSGTGGTGFEILRVPVNGGAPQPFAIDAFSPGNRREPPADLRFAKWSPDGRSMILGRVDYDLETFVIEHPLAVVPAAIASGR
jgi:Tol biopolymer transport system component